MLEQILLQLRKAPPPVQRLAALVFLVGIHSLMLGFFIFFCTGWFYQIFFRTTVNNLFFYKAIGIVFDLSCAVLSLAADRFYEISPFCLGYHT